MSSQFLQENAVFMYPFSLFHIICGCLAQLCSRIQQRQATGVSCSPLGVFSQFFFPEFNSVMPIIQTALQFFLEDHYRNCHAVHNFVITVFLSTI